MSRLLACFRASAEASPACPWLSSSAASSDASSSACSAGVGPSLAGRSPSSEGGGGKAGGSEAAPAALLAKAAARLALTARLPLEPAQGRTTAGAARDAPQGEERPPRRPAAAAGRGFVAGSLLRPGGAHRAEVLATPAHRRLAIATDGV